MKSIINIELFEEHNNLNFYTLRFLNEETEVDKFLDAFPEGCQYDEDIDIIIKWIEQIGERGALERYFRPEGRRRDNVWAIPIEDSKLRLYVLRISESILIIGNGGVKTTKTYNEDAHLNNCVELLQELDVYIRNRLKKQEVNIYKNKLFGNLTFHLQKNYDKE